MKSRRELLAEYGLNLPYRQVIYRRHQREWPRIVQAYADQNGISFADSYALARESMKPFTPARPF
jgi:hypothetical protein